jgi:hypothetical protein
VSALTLADLNREVGRAMSDLAWYVAAVVRDGNGEIPEHHVAEITSLARLLDAAQERAEFYEATS